MIKPFIFRYRIARRIIQFAVIILFVAGNYLGWNVLRGNLTSALFLDVLPLSDPYAVLQMLAAGFVGASTVLVGALVVALFYGLIAGRSFCSWVCPMNLLSDLARWLRKTLSIKSEGLKLSRNLRFWVLGLSFIVSFVAGIAAFEAISPVAMLQRGLIYGMGTEIVVIGAVFLFDFGVKENAWCGHICPLGAFYSVTSKFALIKVKHSAPQCTNCGKCFKVCPEEQVLDIIGIKNGFIRSGACHNCGRCIEVCNDKALRFSLNDYKN